MKQPGPRSTFWLLATLTLASWLVPVYEALAHGAVSMVSVITAAMFASMLLCWPFLNGARVAQGRVQRALMCVECHTLRWPAEAALGFCLQCGSLRPPVRSGY